MFADRYALTYAVIDEIKNNTRRIEGGKQFQLAATAAEDFTYEEARVYAGEIMPVILSAAITTHAKIKEEYKGMPAEVAVARSAIALADALLEELEKTEKKL